MNTSLGWNRILLCIIPLAVSSQLATGQTLVPDVVATTHASSPFQVDVQNTTNGSGLIGGEPDLHDSHGPSLLGTAWLTNETATDIYFDFGKVRSIESFSFWNFTNGYGVSTNAGVKDVRISYSVDGIEFVDLIEGPNQFAEAPYSPVTNFQPVSPEVFDFPPVRASQFRFSLLSNYGNSFYTGFAEVQFAAAGGSKLDRAVFASVAEDGGVFSVPEPNSLPFVLHFLLFVSLGSRLRR
jgi:hypothetical protein